MACSRSRGQPLDSKRQIVVCHSGSGVAVAVDEDDGRRLLERRARGAAGSQRGSGQAKEKTA